MSAPLPHHATQAQKHAGVLHDVVRSYFFVLLWMAISMLVIAFNKWLIAYAGFPFPLTLTLIHMLFCSVIGTIAVRCLHLVPSHSLTSRDYVRRVVPIGALYAASLWLSNTAYLTLSVSFIQMTKSLMPLLVYLCGIAMRTETPSIGRALAMASIAGGVVVCGLGEEQLVVHGLAQQLLALAFEATRLTLVQLLMTRKGVAMNPLQSLYYVSPACLACLIVPWMALEMGEIIAHPPEIYPSILVANAMAAFALNLAVFLLIGKTSALTMNVAGVVKDWALIMFSYKVFKAPLSRQGVVGYVVCCCGVAAYNYQKLQALRRRELQKIKDGSGVVAEGGGKGVTVQGDEKAERGVRQPLLIHAKS